jgi:hypothetical protein
MTFCPFLMLLLLVAYSSSDSYWHTIDDDDQRPSLRRENPTTQFGTAITAINSMLMAKASTTRTVQDEKDLLTHRFSLETAAKQAEEDRKEREHVRRIEELKLQLLIAQRSNNA